MSEQQQYGLAENEEANIAAIGATNAETTKATEIVEQPLAPPVQVPLVKDDPEDSIVANESSHKDKLGIYKALAIKLKKELLKTRDELYKIRTEYHSEKNSLEEQIDTLSKTLESERVVRTNTSATLEATIKSLRNQLEIAENELQSLQKDFDNYKTRAAKLLQQAKPAPLNLDRAFEEERMRQLKILNEQQNEQLVLLRKQVEEISNERDEMKAELDSLNKKLEAADRQVEKIREANEILSSDNENLRSTIEKLKNRAQVTHWNENSLTKKMESLVPTQTVSDVATNEPDPRLDVDDEETAPEDFHTNSNSSVDSSTCSYVHIKPTTFEIISRSSVLEDAQNQIDNLTKAYLDSESTNSLLKEQVSVLKEEIRRIQRGNERMELANNLEYLKNIMFKFLSLDNSQVEQRQRLVPVLSAVLKLSPDETSKLNSIATAEKVGVTSSFFKL